MINAFPRCTAPVALVVSFAALLCSPFPVLAGPILGTAQSFAALGYAGVTNNHVAPNPATHIYGNVGASPATLTSLTGFLLSISPGDGIVSDGTLIAPPPSGLADSAMADIGTAAGYLAGLAPDANLTGQNLGNGRTITPGVYFLSDSEAHLDGMLTLNALGNSNALFVFQLATALVTGPGSVVNVTNGLSDTQVYWVLGTQATLGLGSTFAGNILAGSSVVLQPTAQILCGRALAQSGSVTLIDNLVSNTCEASGSGGNDFGSYGFSGGSGDTQGIPEPGTLTLLSVGLGAGVLLLRKFRSIR